jgi:hypothetical protein
MTTPDIIIDTIIEQAKPAEDLVALDEQNTTEKVGFRESVMVVEQGIKDKIASGEVEDTLPDCLLTHHFTPKDDKYGCHTYAREMLIPKGTIIIGKIHRHQHLNFILKGQVSVATEFGKKYFTGPCVFISEVGLKRAVYAEEDTIWVTVHLTEHSGEENLEKIEQEVIAPSYEEMGLISSMNDLKQLTANTGEQV